MRSNLTPRRRKPETLVLTGPAKMNVHRGRLTFEEGYANLGTRRTVELEPPLAIQSLIILTGAGWWSEAALEMLAENGVPVYSLRQNGAIHWHLIPAEAPSKPGLIRLQASLLESDLGLTVARDLVVEKIARQQDTLNWLSRRAALPGLEEYSSRILPVEGASQAKTIDALRMAEAQAANLYFNAWRGMPVTFQKPKSGCVDVPARWLRFESRVSLKSGRNQDATDPINALLNFCYAVAAAETLIAVRATSLDPSLGVLHEDQDGRPSLIYDLLEPLRPRVDRMVLEWVCTRTFRLGHDFVLLRDGICRLGIELAAEVSKEVSENIRPHAMSIAAMVRKALLSVADVTYRVPRQAAQNERRTPDGRLPASPQGVCCVCGAAVPGNARYCSTHRSERFQEHWRKLWAEGRVRAAHSEEANRKRSDAMRRIHTLKGHGA
ncbi:MAG: CRISPR-associated endonuclease Cas1 [Chthonomonadales bacterium]